MDEDGTIADAARLWTTAQALARRARSVRGPGAAVARPVPPMLLFTDPVRTPRPWEVAERMPPGSGVIYRAFGAAGALTVARRLREVTTQRSMTLLIGRDADLADRVRADGVHLPQAALSAAYALSGRRPHWILTGAVHAVEDILDLRSLDAVFLSPVFQAGGQSANRPALGLERLARAVDIAPCPVLALGGIDAANVEALGPTGVAGFGAIAALVQAYGGSP